MLNFEFLANLSEGWARFLVIMAYIIPLIFAFTLPRKYIYEGAEDQKLWRNLKLWVLVIVAIMVAVYLYF
ncbi:MAG: hypothetical protein GWP06_16290 [Actinobacteria bacterium]|nr:hypothetical protein [Actinomycetota bacterium]